MFISYIESGAYISPLLAQTRGVAYGGQPRFLLVKRDVCVALILPNAFNQIVNLLPHTFQTMHGCAYMVGVWRVGIHLGYPTQALNGFKVIAFQDNVAEDF